MDIEAKCNCQRCDQGLSRFPDQDHDGQHAENGSEGHENAFDAGHHETEGVMSVLREETASRHEQCRQNQTEGDEDQGEKHKNPAEENGWWRLVVGDELVGSEDKHQTDDKIDEGEKDAQADEHGQHIVEDGKQPEMFFILLHDFVFPVICLSDVDGSVAGGNVAVKCENLATRLVFIWSLLTSSSTGNRRR